MSAQHTQLEYHATGDGRDYRYHALNGYYTACSDDLDLFAHAKRSQYYGVGCTATGEIESRYFIPETHLVVRRCNHPHCDRRAAFTDRGNFTYCCVHGIVERSGMTLGDGCGDVCAATHICVCAALPCLCGGG